MRLRRFEIRNFKGIENAAFEIDDMVVLIGENNAGKSTVLQALDWFLGGSQIKDEALFHDGEKDGEHAIELIGSFDQLTESETRAQAVRRRMNGDMWVIKKRFWFESGGAESADGGSWKEAYFSFSSEEQFEGWPSPDTSWSSFPDDYQHLIERIPNSGSRPSSQSREQLRELVRQEKPELVGNAEPAWIANPGGGGNWKSNANSVIPELIFVRAVHDAAGEVTSKEASSYGKIMSLIVERKLMGRPEVIELQNHLENVLKLFRPDPDKPDLQAEEIRALEEDINRRLNEVIKGIAAIKTSEVDVRPMLLPSTTLVLKDREDSPETPVHHQGHGLQRTLIVTLLQILNDIQGQGQTDETGQDGDATGARPVLFCIEEPELYMHPQMERKMRDALYRLAEQPGFQVICTTHSPVFLDISERHKSIVRVVKDQARQVSLPQATGDLYGSTDNESELDRLKLIAQFNPSVNEVFFAKRVVLLEERTAAWAFEWAAELTGLFERHPHVRRDTTVIVCDGKGNIPAFQRALNHFEIPYTVIHDEDRGNAGAEGDNQRIGQLLGAGQVQTMRHMISPTDIENMLGHTPTSDKPYRALKRVEQLHDAGTLPADFLRALNWVYFGQDDEPQEE